MFNFMFNILMICTCVLVQLLALYTDELENLFGSFYNICQNIHILKCSNDDYTLLREIYVFILHEMFLQ